MDVPTNDGATSGIGDHPCASTSLPSVTSRSMASPGDYDVEIEGGEIRTPKKPSKAQADQIDPAIGGKFSKAMQDEEAG